MRMTVNGVKIIAGHRRDEIDNRYTIALVFNAPSYCSAFVVMDRKCEVLDGFGFDAPTMVAILVQL